jgi:DNA-directed RNA polymerase specialized sigma subunit
MKIALNMGPQGPNAKKNAQARILEADILGAKRGDWNAKNNLARDFMPLLHSLAEKRATDVAEINRFIEAGKAGLFAAAKKYKESASPQGFQIFALDFIEARMDRAAKGGGSWLSRLFGR